MTATISIARPTPNLAGNSALNAAATLWFAVVVIGQLIFIAYIVSLYGVATLQGDWEKWNTMMPRGLIAGDTPGNAAVIAHVLIAAMITLSGALQLTPQIRARAPTFHRWNGRAYIVAAFIMGLSGLYMVASRGAPGGSTLQTAAISLNAVLIMVCAVIALRLARARNFAAHRRWALRLFLLVSGVWFFRVGLMFWIIINQGPVGFDPQTFTGPALDVLGFAQYLLPLAVLELYFHAQDCAGSGGRLAMAAGLVVITLAMGVGIFGATTFLWLPNM